jgi:RNA polymerase sigma factor (sigma-70 family)
MHASTASLRRGWGGIPPILILSASLPEFRELPAHLLAGLTDEQLVEYLRAAREAGRHEAMRSAVAVLVHGYWDMLVNRARLKLRTDADAEEVAAEAVASAIASAFDGRSVGEFRSWLHTILSRRIADWWEAREQRLEKTALPSEHLGDEEVWGREPSVGFEGDALHARECLRQALEELPAAHGGVVHLYVLGPHDAAETAALAGAGMTEANVHQIASRFQKRVRELLEAGLEQR